MISPIVETYLYTLEETEILLGEAEIKKLISKIGTGKLKRIKDDFLKSVKKKDINKFMKLSKKVPNLSMNNILRLGKSASAEFEKKYKDIKGKIKRKVKDDTVASSLAVGVAAMASFNPKKSDSIFKDTMKSIDAPDAKNSFKLNEGTGAFVISILLVLALKYLVWGWIGIYTGILFFIPLYIVLCAVGVLLTYEPPDWDWESEEPPKQTSISQIAFAGSPY